MYCMNLKHLAFQTNELQKTIQWVFSHTVRLVGLTVAIRNQRISVQDEVIPHRRDLDRQV